MRVIYTNLTICSFSIDRVANYKVIVDYLLITPVCLDRIKGVSIAIWLYYLYGKDDSLSVKN
jgi:hypothetical protein